MSLTSETTRANPSSGRWNYGREIAENFAESGELRILHAVNLRHGTDGFTSPPKERALRIFSPEKSDGFGRVWTRELGYQRPARSPLDHRSRSYTSTAVGNNEWNYTYTPPLCLQDVYRDNFYLYLLHRQKVSEKPAASIFRMEDSTHSLLMSIYQATRCHFSESLILWIPSVRIQNLTRHTEDSYTLHFSHTVCSTLIHLYQMFMYSACLADNAQFILSLPLSTGQLHPVIYTPTQKKRTHGSGLRN